MAVRTVSVELSAKVAGYVGPVEEAKKATENLDDKVNATDRDLKKLPPDAAKAAAALKAMGVESGHTALALEDVDAKTGKAGTSMDLLKTRLEDARSEVRRLGEEFNKTGNADSLTKLFSAQDSVNELEKLYNELRKVISVVEPGNNNSGGGFLSKLPGLGTLITNFKGVGLKAGSAFDDGFVGALGEMAIAASPVLGPMVAALVAEIAADAGGAIIGGIGLGGMFTGALLQAKSNPEVRAAASGFGSWLMDQLTVGSAPFAAPMLNGIDELKADLAPVLRELGVDFQYLAPYVSQFAMYLGMAAEKFMPGFSRAVQASGPILTELGHGMVYIADGLNVFLDEISKGGKGEVEALDTLFRILGMTLAALGFIIRALANAFDFVVQASDVFVHVLNDIFGWVPLVGSALGSLKDYIDGIANSFDNSSGSADLSGAKFRTLSVAADSLSVAVHSVSTAFDEYFGRAMSVDQANDQLKRDMLGLKDAVDQHGRSLSDNTTAGLANRDSILGIIQDAQRARQAQIDMAGGADASKEAIDQANAAYEATIQRLIDIGVKAGLSRKELEDIVGRYDISVVYTTTYKTRGTPPKAPDYGSIPTGRIGGMREGGIRSYASGGISTAAGAGIYPDSLGPIVQFAEPGTGKEGYLPMQGISRGRAHGILAEEAGWYGYGLTDRGGMGGSWRGAPGGSGGGVAAVALQVSFAGVSDSALGSLVMKMFRDQSITLSAGGVPVRVG